MAQAIAHQRGVPNDDAVLEEATIALCAVLTNAVEVHDNEGRALGIAVFDPTFSWINHSCSPNACYRFILSSPTSSSYSNESQLLRIAPHPQVNYSFFFYFAMLFFACPDHDCVLQMGSGGICVGSDEFAKGGYCC